MKYDENLIYRKHWGGGETQIYEVDGYRALFCLFTGSCFGFYRKEDLNLNNVEAGFWSRSAVPGKVLDGHWDSFRENMETCISRCLDKAKNPETHIEWYEKIPDLEEGKYYLNTEKRCFSSNNSEENRVKIASNPNFIEWYDTYWEAVQKQNELSREKWEKENRVKSGNFTYNK